MNYKLYCSYFSGKDQDIHDKAKEIRNTCEWLATLTVHPQHHISVLKNEEYIYYIHYNEIGYTTKICVYRKENA